MKHQFWLHGYLATKNAKFVDFEPRFATILISYFLVEDFTLEGRILAHSVPPAPDVWQKNLPNLLVKLAPAWRHSKL